MNVKLILKKQIINFLLENPIDDSAPNKYNTLKEKFNIDTKTASRFWIEVKALTHLNKIEPCQLNDAKIKTIFKQEGEQLSVTINDLDFEIRTLEDLLAACEVDTSKWEVLSWQCKKWDLGIKNKNEEIETKPLFSVSAKFRAKKVDNDLKLQKDVILKELLQAAPIKSLEKQYNELFQKFANNITDNNVKDNLLEISLFDVHFGKLAHREEVGEDYDLKIAIFRFKKAVDTLLKRVNISTIEKILFPIGQDLINIDNIAGNTTGGTPQDSDSRFHKIVKAVKQVLIETISRLAIIAPVDVIITVGNHDEQTTFMIGEMLEAYYHNTENVTIFNNATLRKYYQYGVNSIMFTHGNKEKFADLGMIFAAENPKLWADTTQRFIQIGHFHHNKKITTIQSQEFKGFQVQILPSLSGSDAWHCGKGYISLKQAKAFLYNKTEGLVGEFTFSA